MDGVCKALTSFLLQSDPHWQKPSVEAVSWYFLQGDGKTKYKTSVTLREGAHIAA